MTCPWCGSDNIKHNVKQVLSAPIVSVELGSAKIPMMTVSTFSECQCGLVFQENRQPNEWYDWYYSSGTYRATLGMSQEVMDEDEKKRATNLMSFLILNNVTEIIDHLDIGSSRGHFLDKTTIHYGSIGTGLEKTEACHDIWEIVNEDKFNLVSAIHVLEHTIDPVDYLEKMSNASNRYLLIEVPGINTMGGALRFAHLYYFPPELLKAKIEELGFRVVAMETEPNTRILGEKK